MSEAQVIQATNGPPATIDSLVADLRALGVMPGSTLIVHTALSKLGWVCGDAVAVIFALEQALGPEGTLVMPSHTNLSDPANWQNPPVPTDWVKVIQDNMPPYHPDLTPTRKMGAVAETFRKQAGVLRSDHPQLPFAAWGANAEKVTNGQPLNYPHGDNSPLAHIYALDGWVLLLGVGHSNNTSLHLAEARADFPGRKVEQLAAPMLVDGQRQWVSFEDYEEGSEHFDKIGAAFAAATDLQKSGKVGQGTAMLMPQRPLVDFGVEWMMENRK